MRRWTAWAAAALLTLLLATPGVSRAGDESLTEYQAKLGFLYNFAVLTTWPASVGSSLTLCVVGRNPFGDELEVLQGKAVGKRVLQVQRNVEVHAVQACQILFIPSAEAASLRRIVDKLGNAPALTVAESPDALDAGAVLNLRTLQGRITFQASQAAARRAGLALSSKLLRLASEVVP